MKEICFKNKNRYMRKQKPLQGSTFRQLCKQYKDKIKAVNHII